MTDDWQTRIRQQIEAAAAAPESFTATVSAIEETTAGAVYGDTAKDPGRAVIDIEITLDTIDDVMHEALTLPLGLVSWSNKDFKLKKYIDKYGVPEVGQAVEVEITDGFYRLRL